MAQTNELRLFISSTFRDLQEEREYLVKKIFPEIRSLCRQRGITFTEVDLRWGLTHEDFVLGQIIRACLEEVDKCRPYVIGITGDRYGYVPELHEYYKDPELLIRWPWLEEAAIDGSSIIDVEMRHGALNDPASAKESTRFFFRLGRNESDDEETTDEHRNLEALKQRVRDADLPVDEFNEPDELGRMVYDYVMGIIERDFADAKPPTQLEQERAIHAAFAASRTHAYIPNPEYLKRLNAWLASEPLPLVLYAESGSGKSSLVAFWCEQLRRRQPDLTVIEHYIGIGAGDTDHLGIIRHIMSEIKERFNRSEEIPSKPEELEQSFANWLGFNISPHSEGSGPGVKEPMLIIIDGINQLTGHALELHWLPPVMPEGVKLVISSTVEQTLVHLRRQGWQELGMQPLSEREREAVVVRFLAEYRKALSPQQVKLLAGDPKCSHPLFLRTLLEELRLHGTHEHLDSMLTALLESTGTEDLFQQVLQRLENDHGMMLVSEVLTLIRSSRSGLREEELAELTGISRLQLSTLLLGLDYHLVHREGILGFFHDYLRRAVEKRYMSEDGKKRAASGRLAEYFEHAEPTLRSTQELLHALESRGERERLMQVLTEIPRFELLWQSAGRFEVPTYWSGSNREAMTELYRTGLEQWIAAESPSAERQVTALGAIADLYDVVGNWREAEGMHRKRLELIRELNDRVRESRVLTSLSGLARRQGRIEEAESMARSAEEIAQELGDQLSIAHAVGSRGLVHQVRGEYEEALECYRYQERIARESGDKQGITLAVGHRGMVHSLRGEYDEALACYGMQKQLAQELGDRQKYALAVGYHGNVHMHRLEYDKALVCYRESETIARELGDRQNVAIAVGNRGNVVSQRGEFDAAIECYRELEQIAQELGDRQGIGRAVGNRGIIHSERCEYQEALLCYEQATAIHRGIGYRSGITSWITGTARVLVDLCALDQMPEYLPEYLPTDSNTPWRTTSLQYARRYSDESLAISRELSKSDTLFDAQVLLARIDAAEGATEHGTKILLELLEETPDDDLQAELHYWLWKFGNAAHKEHALQLYKHIHATTHYHNSEQRIRELMGDGRGDRGGVD